jgi:hypothetical protein
MLRNLLSGVVGGIGLILAAVGLADGIKWPLIGLGVLLIAASVIGFLWDWRKPKPPSPPPSQQLTPPTTGIRIRGKGHTVKRLTSTGYERGVDIEGEDIDAEGIDARDR